MKYIGGSRAFNFDDEELLSGKGNGLATRIPAEDSEDDDSSIVHCFMKPAVHSHPRGAGDPPDWRILSDAASYFLQDSMTPTSSTLLLMCVSICSVSAEIDAGSTAKILKPWPPENLPSLTDYDSPSMNAESSDEDEKIISVKRADMFVGRRRRAIQELSPELLDQKAAEEIFGEEDKWSRPHQPGPPAPPDPVLYNKQFAVAPSKVQSEIQHEPAIFSKQTRYLPPTSRVTSFDSDVDPNFPADAPRARGLVGEGWQGNVDEEFRTGFRWRAAAPMVSFHRTFEIGPRGRQTFSNPPPVPYSRTFSFSGGPHYFHG
ncbi:hypothetical protein Y032_0008g353 [Ancylostoma ceylanicum]|uniref:Uncharacterized protein n=2 Tax=Ancylostoma ceylanicum TaxID=53326 RepID=A0A016VMZ8_9BILA|nr:hypothetical protein Y032_0008g353 [Ancylostoma ceylanicum]